VASPAASSGSRKIFNRIKGEEAFVSANAKSPIPQTAASSKPMLSDPKLPRPIVMASA
jgi:hypothetical protein